MGWYGARHSIKIVFNISNMHTGHDVARRHKNPVFNASPVTKPMSKSAASINAHFGDFGIMLFKNCSQHVVLKHMLKVPLQAIYCSFSHKMRRQAVRRRLREICAQPCVAMATRSRNLTGFNRAVVECLYLLFFIFTFLHDEWRRMTWYFVTTKQGENFSWFGLRLFFHKFCWKRVSSCRRAGATAASIRWQSYLDLISDIFRCFWYVLLQAFECCLQSPTVIISSRDNLWRKRLFNVMSYGDSKFCLLSFS